jgi:fructose-1,6-bisphosphatase II / sedoheptulose-1,7-bisphosphatase
MTVGLHSFTKFILRRENIMEGELWLHLVRVVEEAAIAAAHTMGRGDRYSADQKAVEAMRRVLDTVPFAGKVVIGEGERDEAPMLFIGEKIGLKNRSDDDARKIDIAVDPLEGTNLCAKGASGAITVVAVSERGGLLHAPDIYMQKLVVGPLVRGAVDLDAPVRKNLNAIARRLGRKVSDLVVVVLDRPRHEGLIREIRKAGARIRLIADGDLSAGISTAFLGTEVHAVMGIGGAPEGVLTAAALRCLNGEILARLVPKDEAQTKRIISMGIEDTNQIFTTAELAPGKEIIFATTGVTDGNLLKGVRFFGEGSRTHTLVMTTNTCCVRFIDTVHISKKIGAKVRFV